MSAESARTILASLSPGERIFLPGSTAELPSLSDALASGDAPPLDITATFVPGVNPSLVGRLPPGATYANLFAGGPRGGQRAGAARHLPFSYAGFCAYLEATTFDTVVVQVAPPDNFGRASLGSAVEFTPIALRRSRRLIAVVNPCVPDIPGAAKIALKDANVVLETDEQLREYDVGSPSAQTDAIAANVARLVKDRAALQIGLGKIPDALLRRLTDRAGLRLQSGMLSDGARALAEAGALDADFAHTSCVHVGTRSYYEWLGKRDGFNVCACDHTHSASLLSQVRGLVAVNSALGVDLFGQANLETLDGRAISGVGGAADFARAASLSADGISVVALPSASADGSSSRLVARLDGLVSLPRHDVGFVVTEYGAADLRGASTMERAERLIAIAHPRHRAQLETSWDEIAGKL